MTKRILTGNEAVAWGALRAGVRVATGYPGTPSTGCIAQLLTMDLPGRHVEWSTNEKVAFEIAAGAAWAGHRALCTMKMSGVNVAYDALISIAYSGTNGGLVVYVADDPGVSAGMPEQDSRGFALQSDLPMLEPASPAEAYRLIQEAFELSEATGAPVFLRSTTAAALSHASVEIDDPRPPAERSILLERDIAKYTKAGSKICLDQHRGAIARLGRARSWIAERGLNELRASPTPGGAGVLAAGAAGAYVDEALDVAGVNAEAVSILRVASPVPFPESQAAQLLGTCATVLVLEELEPYVERELVLLAQRIGWNGRIVGKLDGILDRMGEYGLPEVLRGLAAAGVVPAAASHEPRTINQELRVAETAAAPRPITVCAGCPHRGTYLAIDGAIRRAGFKKADIMVTGDIGCTILGMNPPFDLLWNEVSMGSSISLAQGYVHSGIATPVVATIGDSTFFHGGVPGLVNAIQHRVPLTLVVMDNGWTAMTGMQVNAGTGAEHQGAGRRVDLVRAIEGFGPDSVTVVDPYDVEATTAAVARGLTSIGVDVVVAQRECAIQARRRKVDRGRAVVDAERCIACKKCLRVTGCPALGLSSAGTDEKSGNSDRDGFDSRSSDAEPDASDGRPTIVADVALCNGCGICVGVCPTGALRVEPSGKAKGGSG